MSNFPQNHEDDLLLTFQDLVRVIKQNSRKIWTVAVVFALLAFVFSMTRPVAYLAEATFKERNKSESGLNKSLFLQLVGDANDSDALTMMNSRKLVEHLILQRNWQAIVTKSEHSWPFFSWQTIKNNILTEYAWFFNLRHPIVSHPKKDIKIDFVSYKGEVPLKFKLKINSDNEYTIFGNQGEIVGTGIFNQPFKTEAFSFTLQRINNSDLTRNDYHLTLLPLGKLATEIQKEFKIDVDRLDKSLIKISYKHSDRHEAALAVENLMSAYQNHLNNEHQRTSDLQVAYLMQRQEEMAKQLALAMAKHADSLAQDLSNTGFATSGKAMEFLAQNQQTLKQKLLAIELDMQRLQNMRQSNEIDYENITSANTPETINRISAEIRSLKQQGDALNLTLRNSPANSEAFQQSFDAQIAESENVKNAAKQANSMLSRLAINQMPEPYPLLMDNPKFIVRMWYKRAQECFAKRNENADSKSEWEKCNEGFSSYLSQLAYYLNIYQSNIQERLTHQQTPLADFQGINLNTAKELYINYSKELSDTESQAIQQRFIINQINAPSFEISSLSSVLKDPISTEMISKASGIILALKDFENRTPKEQERLKADLAIQKGFLTTHLEQSLQLLDLRQQYLKEKILSLQSINLSLVHDQISLLENQIEKYIANAIDNYKQEQKLLQNNLMELRKEMAAFPPKWAAEQLIEQQMKINQTMVEEITKLVESKNISNNLEKIQSAPLDHPVVPIHPKSPRLVLWTLIGTILGMLVSTAWVLARSVAQGIQIGSENLRLAGFHVSGALSRQSHHAIKKDHILDEDLNTLRRLTAFITQPSEDKIESQKRGKCLLVLKSNGPNYARSLAEIMAIKGLKILIIDLSFDDVTSKETGILQYMENKATQPKIIPGPSYDTISSGGICRYANEMISSHPFQELITKLDQDYDWIFIISKAQPQCAEAETLLELFPIAVISVTNESWEQLRHCLHYARQPTSKISFIMTHPTSNWNGSYV